MSRKANEIPTYRLKRVKSSTGWILKYAVVSLTDGFGQRRDVLLGPWKSKENKRKCREVTAQWEATGRTIYG